MLPNLGFHLIKGLGEIAYFILPYYREILHVVVSVHDFLCLSGQHPHRLIDISGKAAGKNPRHQQQIGEYRAAHPHKDAALSG